MVEFNKLFENAENWFNRYLQNFWKLAFEIFLVTGEWIREPVILTKKATPGASIVAIIPFPVATEDVILTVGIKEKKVSKKIGMSIWPSRDKPKK